MEKLLRTIARMVVVMALAILCLSEGAWSAETYPARAIRLVVPFPPGGGNDAMGRIVAEKLGGTLGQRVVIDNKGGAGGMVGTVDVIKSAPNGYTLLLGHTGSLAMSPHLYQSAHYDPRRDLAPVGLIGRIPLVMVMHSQAPVKTMKHFIKRLNAQLNKLLGSEDVKNLLYTDGVTTQPGAPEQYKAVIAGDYEKWGEVIRRAGVKVD